MRAAVMHEIQQPLAVEEIDVENPREGEVLVRIAASGVCRSDLHALEGESTVQAGDAFLHFPSPPRDPARRQIEHECPAHALRFRKPKGFILGIPGIVPVPGLTDGGTADNAGAALGAPCVFTLAT